MPPFNPCDTTELGLMSSVGKLADVEFTTTIEKILTSEEAMNRIVSEWGIAEMGLNLYEEFDRNSAKNLIRSIQAIVGLINNSDRTLSLYIDAYLPSFEFRLPTDSEIVDIHRAWIAFTDDNFSNRVFVLHVNDNGAVSEEDFRLAVIRTEAGVDLDLLANRLCDGEVRVERELMVLVQMVIGYEEGYDIPLAGGDAFKLATV